MVTLSADSGLAILRDLTNRVWCHKKDSNLLLPPYQDDTLPTELLWHKLVEVTGFEPVE